MAGDRLSSGGNAEGGWALLSAALPPQSKAALARLIQGSPPALSDDLAADPRAVSRHRYDLDRRLDAGQGVGEQVDVREADGVPGRGQLQQRQAGEGTPDGRLTGRGGAGAAGRGDEDDRADGGGGGHERSTVHTDS